MHSFAMWALLHFCHQRLLPDSSAAATMSARITPPPAPAAPGAFGTVLGGGLIVGGGLIIGDLIVIGGAVVVGTLMGGKLLAPGGAVVVDGSFAAAAANFAAAALAAWDLRKASTPEAAARDIQGAVRVPRQTSPDRGLSGSI